MKLFTATFTLAFLLAALLIPATARSDVQKYKAPAYMPVSQVQTRKVTIFDVNFQKNGSMDYMTEIGQLKEKIATELAAGNTDKAKALKYELLLKQLSVEESNERTRQKISNSKTNKHNFNRKQTK